MTNREVVSKLQQRGYSITYVERNDGSIRVERIVSPKGNVKFDKSRSSNPSAGNNVARKIAGEKLSEKQSKQRKKPNEKKHKKKVRKEKTKAAHKRKEKLSKSLEEALKKAQKKLREAGKGGILTKKRVRKHKARTDAKSTKKAIENIVLHEMGYAYAQSVADLIEFLKINFYSEQGTDELIDELMPYAKGKKLLLDKIVADIYDIYYDVGKFLNGEPGIPPRQGAETAIDLIKHHNI